MEKVGEDKRTREKVSKNRNKQVERRELESEVSTEEDKREIIEKEREKVRKNMSSVHLFKIPGSLKLVTISGTPLSPALSRKRQEMGCYFLGRETSRCHRAQILHAEKKYTKEEKSDNHRLPEQRAKISMDLQREAIGWFSNYIHSSIHLYLSLCNFHSVLDTELIMCITTSEKTATFLSTATKS